MMKNKIKKISVIIIILLISFIIIYSLVRFLIPITRVEQTTLFSGSYLYDSVINKLEEETPVVLNSTVYDDGIRETIKEQPYSKKILEKNHWYIHKVEFYRYTYNLIEEANYRDDWGDVEVVEYYGNIIHDVAVEAKKYGIPVNTEVEDPPLSSDLQQISDLSHFNDFNNLKELTVQYTAIIDLKGIENFDTLEYVDVRNNSQLTTINYVENLPNLKTLCVSVDKVKYITQESYDYLLKNNVDIYPGTFRDDNELFGDVSDDYVATPVDKFVNDNNIEIV